MAQLGHQEIADLAAELHEVPLTCMIGPQLFGKQAIRGKNTPLVIQVPQGLDGVLCHEVLGVFAGQIHFFLGKGVFAGNKVEDMEDGVVDLDGHGMLALLVGNALGSAAACQRVGPKRNRVMGGRTAERLLL